MTHSNHIHIVEVGLRDGLQRETHLIPTAEKIAMINGLVDAGIKQIQVTSFVHPKLVPQMADAEAVCAGINRVEGVVYSALVLNMKGLERAIAAGLTHVDISFSASDAHSRQNANRSLEQARSEFAEMVNQAVALGLSVRAGIQCAFGFYGNDVTPALVYELAQAMVALPIESLSLADSAGLANPRQIREMVMMVNPLLGDKPLILHLHDTRGMGIANAIAGIESGCRWLDTAFGGMGGCNFIQDAAGNIATEDTNYMLHGMGYDTGIDGGKVAQVSRKLAQILGKPLPGKLYQLVTPS